MAVRAWAVLLVAAALALPLPASAGLLRPTEDGPVPGPGNGVPFPGAGARATGDGVPGAGGPEDLDLDSLPGVAEARSRRLWVSATPLIRMGLFAPDAFGTDGAGGAQGTGGEEGGASGRALEMKYAGDHCKVYVDSNAKPYPSDAAVRSLGDEFDLRIWPNCTATFGSIIYQSIDVNVINIDGAWGVGGYFSPANPNSIYLDCADLNYWGYQIAAHEFQHLIHNQKDPDEELWVNEGCADIAIAVIYGQDDGTLTGHVDAFESYPDNDLTVFQNQMHDYGSAYAFAQYFWDRFGGADAVRDLVSEKANGISGINDVLEARGYERRFPQVFWEWAVASRVDDPSLDEGQYGYSQLRVQVALAGDWSSLPVQSDGQVQRWASDCYRFRGGTGLDLLVSLCATSGSHSPKLLGIGTPGNPTTVVDMPPEDGNRTALLRAFGRDFSEGLLFTPSSSGGEYAYDARLVDRTPPVTTAVVLPDLPNGLAGHYTSPPTVTLRPNEENCRTLYWWDAPPELDYREALSPPEGNHTLWFCSVDPSGNREPDRSCQFLVDTVAPGTLMTVLPERPDGQNGWYVTPPVIELAAESGASLFFCWDGAPAENYTGPLTGAEGKHRLECFSVDAAGNEGDTSYLELWLDTVPPSATANLTPSLPDGSGGWYLSAPAVELSSDEPGAQLIYSWDNSSEASYVRPLRAPEGLHRLFFRARDPAGHEGPRQELPVRVDSQSPEAALSVEPRNPDGKNGWYRTRPKVEMRVADADPAAFVRYAWDGGELKPYYGTILPPEGVHVLRFVASDTRGNAGAESTRTFRVDSSPPLTSVTISPADLGEEWYREAPVVTLGSDPYSRTWCSWDGEASALYSGPLAPAEGDHELAFFSKDEAGNSERARTLRFRVDTAPPTAALEPSATSLLVGDVLHLDASGSSDANGLELFSFDFGDGFRRSGSSGSAEHQYDISGTFTVTLKVRDVSGTWSEPATATVTVALPPEPPAPPPADSSRVPAAMELLPYFVLVLAVAGAAWALARRRRQG